MNEKFYDLSNEKRLAIINSGFEVFGTYSYIKASTDLIAAKAGISKGLLFYYFHNKLMFFKYLYMYAENLMRTAVEQSDYAKSTDFFEALEIITERKCLLLRNSPFIMNFIVTANYSTDDRVCQIIKESRDDDLAKMLASEFANIDYTKFRDDVSPNDVIEILSYSLDGYLQHKLRRNEALDINKIMQKYKTWAQLLKQSSYR